MSNTNRLIEVLTEAESKVNSKDPHAILTLIHQAKCIATASKIAEDEERWGLDLTRTYKIDNIKEIETEIGGTLSPDLVIRLITIDHPKGDMPTAVELNPTWFASFYLSYPERIVDFYPYSTEDLCALLGDDLITREPRIAYPCFDGNYQSWQLIINRRPNPNFPDWTVVTKVHHNDLLELLRVFVTLVSLLK